MARYLVTGGAGFIGSHIVEELLKRGEYVRVLDNFSTGKAENLEEFGDEVEVIKGDIRDSHALTIAMSGIDYVLHQAALPSVPRSIEDPLECNAVNVNGTLNVLCAARDYGVKRVVYAGSSSAYGNVEISPKHEGISPAPASPYAAAKLSGEYYCQVFHEVYGLETVVLRYFNVFGPRQDPDSPYSAVIPIFAKLMMSGKPATINGDGTQTRDFTYVKNNALANLIACEVPEAAGKVFNIACGDSISLLQLVNAINEFLKTNIQPVFGPMRDGDVMHSCADITRAQDILGFKPQIGFEEGLAPTLEYIRTLYSS